jgi:hypothetical protein
MYITKLDHLSTRDYYKKVDRMEKELFFGGMENPSMRGEWNAPFSTFPLYPVM